MTSYLPVRTYHKIVNDLEKQGAGIKIVSKGWLIRFPNGRSTCLHTSGSDRRGLLNFRADVLRAGLAWPLDKSNKNSA